MSHSRDSSTDTCKACSRANLWPKIWRNVLSENCVRANCPEILLWRQRLTAQSGDYSHLQKLDDDIVSLLILCLLWRRVEYILGTRREMCKSATLLISCEEEMSDDPVCVLPFEFFVKIFLFRGRGRVASANNNYKSILSSLILTSILIFFLTQSITPHTWWRILF